MPQFIRSAAALLAVLWVLVTLRSPMAAAQPFDCSISNLTMLPTPLYIIPMEITFPSPVTGLTVGSFTVQHASLPSGLTPDNSTRTVVPNSDPTYIPGTYYTRYSFYVLFPTASPAKITIVDDAVQSWTGFGNNRLTVNVTTRYPALYGEPSGYSLFSIAVGPAELYQFSPASLQALMSAVSTILLIPVEKIYLIGGSTASLVTTFQCLALYQLQFGVSAVTLQAGMSRLQDAAGDGTFLQTLQNTVLRSLTSVEISDVTIHEGDIPPDDNTIYVAGIELWMFIVLIVFSLLLIAAFIIVAKLCSRRIPKVTPAKPPKVMYLEPPGNLA